MHQDKIQTTTTSNFNGAIWNYFKGVQHFFITLFPYTHSKDSAYMNAYVFLAISLSLSDVVKPQNTSPS